MVRTVLVHVVVAVALVVTPFVAVTVASGPAASPGQTVQADPERCC
jgi:hypothetical protein